MTFIGLNFWVQKSYSNKMRGDQLSHLIRLQAKPLLMSIKVNDLLKLREILQSFQIDSIEKIVLKNHEGVLYELPELTVDKFRIDYSKQLLIQGQELGTFQFEFDLLELSLSVAMSKAFIFSSILICILITFIFIMLFKVEKIMLSKYVKYFELDKYLLPPFTTDKVLQETKNVISQQLKKIDFEVSKNKRFKFFNQIIHDLKSPLTVLNSLIENDYSDDLLLREVQLRISDIVESVQNDKKKVSQTERVSIHSILESLISEKRIEYSTKKNITFSLHGVPSVEIITNKFQFKRVISNILNNSIEADATQIDLTINVSSIVIKDNGSGISEVNVKKFNNFEHVELGKDTSEGLGLNGFYNFIKEHNYTYLVRSSGRGTSITINFN